MEKLNILVIGGGGREHALCWKLRRSPRCGDLYCLPGNAGIAQTAQCIDGDVLDQAGILAVCADKNISLVVIGPEIPLIHGLADALNAAGVRAFGPSAQAARLEGSKGFMKDLCADYGIPTARYRRCASVADAERFIKTMAAPIVVKADGPAAGKGVVIAQSTAEAVDSAVAFLRGHPSVVIEEFLSGEEVSFFALCDGATAIPFASAQDHKRAFDNDQGPNTGGMGAYSPAPLATPDFTRAVMQTIITPTLDAMRDQGTPFTGVLYAGLMVSTDGIRLLEYNVRFGDPECQALMPRLESDLVDVLLAATDRRLDAFTPEWSSDAALTIVYAANGYPGAYENNTVINGLEPATDALVFHAGTRRDADGTWRAAGGRVLNVTATAPTIRAARQHAYAAISRIVWPQGFYRKDIGQRALEK